MGIERFEQLIDKSSKPVKNEVEKGAIRKFARAIGDDNPLYFDEEYAKTTRYGRIIAPPTFSRTFDFGKIEGLEWETKGLIHANESFRYYRPIYAGDILFCSNKLVKVFEREGKLGHMTFLVFQQTSADESGNPVLESHSTIIYRGA